MKGFIEEQNKYRSIMITMLYILGVSSIKEFALPLIVGVVGGALSSIFLTGLLWRLMKGKVNSSK